jgi:hypothetical protein
MGSLSDNGGGWPPDGGMPDGLPDLPPEWGDIVIPDDLSELSAQVADLRAELRRDHRRSTWQRRTDHWGLRFLRHLANPRLRGPALIVGVAVFVTVASLFASSWTGPARQPAVPRAGGAGSDNHTLPALSLIDVDEQPVPLRGQVPAVILLIDGCDCVQLIADTAAAVRPDIAVITVVTGTDTSAAPGNVPRGTGPAVTGPTVTGPGNAVPPTQRTPPTQTVRAVRHLRDPTGELRRRFDLITPPDGTAAALLVSGANQIVRSIPRTISIEDLRPDLARL